MRRFGYASAFVGFMAILALGCAHSETATVAQTNSGPMTPAASPTPSPTPAAAVKHEGDKLRPSIISRKDWEAADPVGTAVEHSISLITIHHTAVKQDAAKTIETKMRGLQKFSQSASKLASGKEKPAWFDVPYHFYVAVDGKIAEGRELKFAGDTNTEYDPRGHALIVAEGNFEEEEPTAEQVRSIKALVTWLSVRWNVGPAGVKAHDDYASTACPGDKLKSLLPSISDAARKPGKEKAKSKSE